MAIDKIKRNFVWLRRVLGIIDKTTLPGEIVGEVRPTMDIFGWDRLFGPTEHDTSGVAAPATTVSGPVTPDDVLRVVLHASVVHTDTGVTHFLWIDKLMPIGGFIVGMPVPLAAVPVDVDVGTQSWIFLEPGSTLRGRADTALVAGALVLDINFIDLPAGEYIRT